MTALAPTPPQDERSFDDLRDELIARIPIHNPEWTNFNRSDPGVTLIELFAFLGESLIYRFNQMPDRMRRAFLALLGVPLQPASSARGLVAFSLDGGPPAPVLLHADVEVRAGQVPFRTDTALDVLPVEARAYYKRKQDPPAQQTLDYYAALYASYLGPQPDAAQLQLYDTVPLGPDGVDLGATVDRSLWIALLLRRNDGTGDAAKDLVRGALAGRTLSLGLVPVLDDPDAQLSPLGRGAADAPPRLDYQLPRVAGSGSLGATPADRIPRYRSLDAVTAVNVLDEPGVVQLTLPEASGLTLWNDVDPLEAGVGDMPPALDDPRLADRTVTWLRIQAAAASQVRLQWAGINATMATQQARVLNEVLPAGTGAPDQSVALAHSPVLPDTLALRVGAPPAAWTRIDDLYAAGPEVPVPDLRLPPGAAQPRSGPATVFAVDAAAGVVRFGDGLHGARPPAGAPLRADYAYGAGTAGNVAAGTISSGPALPAGVKVTNPVRTWGGAEAESVADAERQVARYLRHRDRLVSAEDFDAIVRRTPGADVGRVDVVPAYNPELAASAPGDAPGAVTLMLVPTTDPLRPDAPQPDQPFLDAVCAYLDPRRLVTTEVFLRGPAYKPIWLSVGFDPVAGRSVAEVRDAIRSALRAFLSPLPTEPATAFPHAATGWPRGKPVVPLELLAVASRVDGVDLVRPVALASGDAAGSTDDPVPMTGLELPVIAGLEVRAGDAASLDDVRGLTPAPQATPAVVPVPIVPETC